MNSKPFIPMSFKKLLPSEREGGFKQVIHLCAWEDSEGLLICAIMQDWEMDREKRGEKMYDYTKVITGKTAIVVIHHSLYDRDEDDFKKLAIAFMTGRYVIVEFNLDRCRVKYQYPNSNPPY